MRRILGELRFNLRRNIFINIILIVQCVLAAWLFITVASYYVDLPAWTGPENIKGGFGYYELSRIGTEEQHAATESISEDPQYIDNLKLALAEAKADPRFTFMAIDMNQGFPISNTLFEEHFGGPVPFDFYGASSYPGYFDDPVHQQEELPIYPHTTIRLSAARDVLTCRIDENAFRHYNLQVSAGRPFEEADYILNEGQATIPLLLGDAYKPYFSVGDILFNGLSILQSNQHHPIHLGGK